MKPMLTYTVGVRSPFSFFYTRYTVLGHSMNFDIPGSVRLALSLVDGSVIMVPNADKKYFKLFPDFKMRNDLTRRIREDVKEQPDAEIFD